MMQATKNMCIRSDLTNSYRGTEELGIEQESRVTG
jgi:hypothetical protein